MVHEQASAEQLFGGVNLGGSSPFAAFTIGSLSLYLSLSLSPGSDFVPSFVLPPKAHVCKHGLMPALRLTTNPNPNPYRYRRERRVLLDQLVLLFIQKPHRPFLTPTLFARDAATRGHPQAFAMRRLVLRSTAYPACHARMRMAAHGLRAEPRLSRRLCTDRSDPYAVLGVLQTADQVPF